MENHTGAIPEMEDDGFKRFRNIVEQKTGEVTLGDDMKRLNVTVKSSNPFQFKPAEHTNTVQKVDPKKNRNDQIEAIIQMIETVKNLHMPRGLVLNPEKVSVPSGKDYVDFDKVAKVLGKGNSAGEVLLVRDQGTGQDVAIKTVMLTQFHQHEVWAWIHLADAGMAPELYHFELKDNKVIYSMEPMEGKTLQDVIDENKIEDPQLAASYSLCILSDLLEMFNTLQNKQYTHGDMHGGNVQLLPSMKIKLFDFGLAKKLLKDGSGEDARRIKNDIIGIIRIFCALYSGFDFNDLNEARKMLEANDLSSIGQYMGKLSIDQRKELFTIMSMLFDTVRNPEQERFGDTSQVAMHVQSLLPEDLSTMKKKVAVILFPELYHEKTECDGLSTCEMDMKDQVPIWDDPDMDDFILNVTDQDLERLCRSSLV